ncbi:uncharacterized protein EV420DRAFT_1550081 [Desarmillaria tabescens]|uniref:Uncharacterized protein n=1 Tax=Armillaria tabescens TaxID=1929756 RepID=A0AA39KC86_ARMTA|nr:uncharacterized protein EV420DRAFT_1550081 [Desarmillaria tabescens]KAK0457305.1 hypothetical protein EV420DRAFT_1550081 [Desarmillaria tabescens]
MSNYQPSMDDRTDKMQVIGGYSYTYSDVKIMSARMDPPPHPACPPISLFAKIVIYLTKKRLLVASCEDNSVPERRRLVVATQSKWVPLNNEGLATRFYHRDPEDTLLKKEFCKIFPGLTGDPEYVTLADHFFEVSLSPQQRLPIVMTASGPGPG